MKNIELKNCDFVKTLLMLLVVVNHSSRFWLGNGFTFCAPVLRVSELSSIPFSWLASWRLYAFTLISGYLFYYLRFEKKAYQETALFLRKKIQRLLIPAYFVGLIWVIPISSYFRGNWLKEFFKFISGVSPSQLWFLFMLFDVFIMAYIMGKIINNNRLCWIIVTFVYFLNVLGGKLLPNVFQIWTACSFFPIFVVGMKLRAGSLDFIKKIPLIVWFMADILLFALFRYLQHIPGMGIKFFNIVGIGLLLHIVGALMAFFFLQKLAVFWDWQSSKWFMFVKEHNVTVYFFHLQIIYFVIVALNGLINPYLHMGINFVVSLFLSLLISVILSRFKTTRFLLGMK